MHWHWQIVNAWHRHGCWLGDIKPSNFVLGLVTTTDDEGHATPGSLRVFVIDLEAVVSDFARTVRVCCPDSSRRVHDSELPMVKLC